MSENSSSKPPKPESAEFPYDDSGEAIPIDEVGEIIKEAAQEELAEAQVSEDNDLYALEMKSLEVEALRLKLGRVQQLFTVRKRYTGLLFGLTVLWLLVVIVFVGFTGFRFRDFTLSDNVIIAFITSTTVSVLGLFHFAAKWLFPPSRDDS